MFGRKLQRVKQKQTSKVVQGKKLEKLSSASKMPPTGQPRASDSAQVEFETKQATREAGGAAPSKCYFSFEFPDDRCLNVDFYNELSVVPYTDFERDLPPAAVLPYELERSPKVVTRKRRRTQTEAPTRKSLRRSKSSDTEQQEAVLLNLATQPLTGSASSLASFTESLTGVNASGPHFGPLQYVWDAMHHVSDPYVVRILAGEDPLVANSEKVILETEQSGRNVAGNNNEMPAEVAVASSSLKNSTNASQELDIPQPFR